MRSRILHETKGRMRVHIEKPHVSGLQADLLEEYLRGLSFVADAKVDERTKNARIRFLPEHRKDLLEAISVYDFSKAPKEISGHSSRELSRTYEDKLIFHVAKRILSRTLLPLPVRTVLTVAKAVPYLGRGLRALGQGKLAVSVLDAASISVSLLQGEFDTAGSIIFLLALGDIMEEWTHKKSVEDLAGAMSLNVDKVWLLTEDGQEILTGIDRVKPGDRVVVRTGNMIPLDGTVWSGEGMVNQASITGEPLAVHKAPGGSLYAGTVVEEGQMVVMVRQKAGTGRYDRIVKMIEESEKLKSTTEDKASHLADTLVPWTFAATGLTWLVTGDVARAASILMVDFCCALKLSMPIAVLSAMREAGEHHILVKGGKFIENAAEADTIVFDKTGTLTMAAPRVHDIVPFGGSDSTEMLRLAACLEEHYPHSIANAVVAEAARRGLVHREEHSRVEYIVAHGIASSIRGQKVCIGSSHFIFEDEKSRIPEGEEERFEALPDEYSHLYLAIEGVLSAVILIEDPIKKEASVTIRQLHELGISRAVMMTGDSGRTARAVAAIAGVDEYMAEVLPEDKADFIRKERAAGHKVIMIGDGVNDAPALSEADCGVAINSGAAIAREIADITISEDDLYSLVVLRRISMGLMRRTQGNYRTIISFNAFLILMGILGILPASATALLHNGSTIAISLKSMTNLLSE